MHVTKVRFWILAFLLFLYLAGVLILSAVTLHEPRGGGDNSKVSNQFSLACPQSLYCGMKLQKNITIKHVIPTM